MVSARIDAKNLETIDVTGWDFSETINAWGIFSYYNNGENNLTTIIGLDTWRSIKIKDFSQMFFEMASITELDLSSFDTSSAENMANMIACNPNLVTLNVDGFDTTHVWNMEKLFAGDISLKILDLSSFDTSNVKYMNNMFDGDISLEEIDFSNADFSNVLNSTDMFKDVPATVTIYVKDMAARDWIITNGGNSNLTVDNVLIK